MFAIAMLKNRRYGDRISIIGYALLNSNKKSEGTSETNEFLERRVFDLL
jgi:hypothetical protein